MAKGLERIGLLPIDDVRKMFQFARERKLRFIEINGIVIKMSSQRYTVFLKTSGTVCKCCGREAKYFAIEKQDKDCKHYILNLYGVGKKGGETLFTKDHRVPRSLGGRNIIENYQTLCEVCNSRKGNTLNPNDLIGLDLNKVCKETVFN